MTPDELNRLADEATPGPWRFTQEDGLVRDAEDYHIVKVAGSPRHPQLAASARLIALAPDLARLVAEMGEILKWVADTPTGDLWARQENVDRVRAALARLSELETRP